MIMGIFSPEQFAKDLADVGVSPETVRALANDVNEEVFKPLRTFFQRQGIAASFEARVGSPAFKLSDTADRSGYDLIMLGSHGRSALGNLVLGSVTTQVLALCKTPVLVIR